jgi:hypothetical protein
MAKTALSGLQEQIEAIRQEAYATGYAAAMLTVSEFSTQTASGSGGAARGGAGKPAPAVSGKPKGRRGRSLAVPARPAADRKRPGRGTNARLISEILREAASDFIRPAAIRTALQKQKATIAFTSIRHALGQLQARGEVEPSSDGKNWRYVGTGS